MDINLTPARTAYDALENKGQVVVAVIDTGVQTDHEDLKNSIWTNLGETAGDGVEGAGGHRRLHALSPGSDSGPFFVLLQIVVVEDF